jgi:diguanylate cyclase (GGDEF)-like protein
MGRRFGEVIAEVVAAAADDLSAAAVLEQLGAALSEVLPGVGAAVVLHGETQPHQLVAPAPGPTLDGPVEIPLRVTDQHLGTLRVYPGAGARPDDDTVRILDLLAGVTAACLRMARVNDDLRSSLQRAREGSLHDPLTGLPNRVLLLDRVDQALARSRRSDRVTAVLFADLDDFKGINDAYGHGVGDALLVAFAGRLRGLLRPGDTAARLGGDEFVVLCEDLADPADAESIGARLSTALNDPFSLAVGTVRVTASIGVVTTDQSHHSAAALLDDADAAMYQVKRSGGKRAQVIDRRTDAGSGRTVAAVDLAAAIRQREIRPRYQSVVGAVDGAVLGASAAAAWDHPTRGRLGPAELMPMAERTGLLAALGRSMLEQVCVDRNKIARRHGPMAVSLDVATRHLLSPGFASMVAEVLDAAGTEPSALILELCEEVVSDHGERAIPMLERLRALGVRLALDGFGVGKSSLRSLRGYQFDTVKLDSRLVGELAGDPATHATVFATVELAHLLGMTVVAEGIETEEQRREVILVGCDYAQGHLFSDPVDAGGLAALFASPGEAPTGG